MFEQGNDLFRLGSAAKARGEWLCGHPRTPENTQRVGVAGLRCRICRRTIARNWWRAHAAKSRAAIARKELQHG